MLNLKVKFRESSVRLPIPRIGRTEHRYNFVTTQRVAHPEGAARASAFIYEDRLGNVCWPDSALS